MTSPLRKLFGTNLKAFRKERGYTQAELAERINRSVYLISQIERGENAPSFETIEDLCKTLGISPKDLFNGSELIGGIEKTKFAKLQGKLAKLSDKDLDWVENVLQAVLKK
ncbi:MAG: helix-turn-helix transcriptional regulator [Litorimonas sp.]